MIFIQIGRGHYFQIGCKGCGVVSEKTRKKYVGTKDKFKRRKSRYRKAKRRQDKTISRINKLRKKDTPEARRELEAITRDEKRRTKTRNGI